MGEERCNIFYNCPYDWSHVVPANRLEKHLSLCRPEDPELNLTICYYLGLYHTPREDLRDRFQRGCHDLMLHELDKKWCEEASSTAEQQEAEHGRESNDARVDNPLYYGPYTPNTEQSCPEMGPESPKYRAFTRCINIRFPKKREASNTNPNSEGSSK
uniref:CHHC U11-48K-type domain-containing protein n=1 Tax=Anopheles culicifacies TaxID=139723 RepID=A0A182LVG1_9DIPT